MSENKQHTVGSFLCDYLYSKGVTHAFGLPGDFALPTFRWFEQSPITLLTLTHEPSVGFAADGYARMSNQLGVALVTYCVGGLNMLNAVACAYAEKSPLLVISGGPSPSDRKADPLIHHKVRTFDTQRRIYEEVTCATAVLLDPATAAQEIMRVIAEVEKQCRPGYIEVPFDVVDMLIPPPVLLAAQPQHSDAENLSAALDDAAHMIANAKQPVIIADVELHRHGLTDLALELANKLDLPIASTLLSKSVISEQNPHHIGVYSGGLSQIEVQQFVESSDCVILLGAFISDVFLGMNTAKLERKQSILATSEKIRIGLRGYDTVQLADFMHGLCARDIKRLKANREGWPKPLPAPKPLSKQEQADAISIASFFRIVGLTIGENDTLICDTGDALLGAIHLRTATRNHFLADAYYLSMGFAVPASIGAMVAAPNSRAFCIVGDGAFQMTGVELSTAAKYGLNPIVFVLNNDGYGTQRHILDGAFNQIVQWNYAAITDLIGVGYGVKVHSNGELEQAIATALEQSCLSVIEVMVPRADCSEPLRRMGEELGKLRDATKRDS